MTVSNSQLISVGSTRFLVGLLNLRLGSTPGAIGILRIKVVPEPAGRAMLVAGLLSIGICRWLTDGRGILLLRSRAR